MSKHSTTILGHPARDDISCVAIVIPCFNEEAGLAMLIAQLDSNLSLIQSRFVYTYVLVDDGSCDMTWDQIKALALQSDHISGLRLSRNFGHQKALLAGIEFALEFSDYILSMDADLQHPPQTAVAMLNLAVDEHYDVVSGQRDLQSNHGLFKDISSKAYYRIMRLMGTAVVPQVSDFRVMSKRAAEALISHGDAAFFHRGLVSRIGFNQTFVAYHAAERFAGSSKYSIKKMLRLASEGISTSSIAPLRLAFVLSVALLLACLLMIIYIFIIWIGGHALPGWASTTIPIYALFGMNFLILGVLGEYIGKAYIQTLGRPRYILRDQLIAPILRR